MRWFVVCLAALSMVAGYIPSNGLGADSAQLNHAQVAAIGYAAFDQAQAVAQAPAGNAVPVTADNFNRAEADMYFGKIVKGGGIGNLSHRRELYLTDSPVVRPNRDTLYSLGVFDFDAGPILRRSDS